MRTITLEEITDECGQTGPSCADEARPTKRRGALVRERAGKRSKNGRAVYSRVPGEVTLVPLSSV